LKPLGLSLTSKRAPLEVLVIDSMSFTSACAV